MNRKQSMQKKKILYVITKWGGAQRYVFDIASHLPKNEFDVAVASGGKGELMQKLSDAGIRTIPIPHLERDINILKEISSLFSLRKIFKSERPDIIHLNSSKIGGLGALAARTCNLLPTTRNQKAKIVFTAHGWPFNEERSLPGRCTIWFLSWLTAFFSHSTIVLTKRDLYSTIHFPFLSPRRFALIPNGISETPHMYFSKKEARKQLGIDQSVFPVIGTIAELTKNKGVRFAVSALRELPERARLILVGEGEEKKELEKLVRDLRVANRVHFTGFKPNARRFLNAFDVFILPSIKEGLPYTILEAGMAGLPIVASNVGGVPDIIEHEIDGLLVRPKNPSDLATAVKKLIDDESLRRRIGGEIKKKIFSKFTFKKMLDETLALYR